MSSKNSASVATMPIHNPALPRVSVTINDKEYLLEYDFGSVAKAEELTGMNLFSSFDFRGLTASRFRAMLYSSLLKNQPKTTLEDAGKLITPHSLPFLVVKLVEAWNGSRPEVVDEGNAEAEADEVSE